jgi:hypothetical protein
MAASLVGSEQGHLVDIGWAFVREVVRLKVHDATGGCKVYGSP